jgi:hypothetical protein
VVFPNSTDYGLSTVDDTAARHQANNGFCTQIGNAHFTAFATSPSNSRLNPRQQDHLAAAAWKAGTASSV